MNAYPTFKKLRFKTMNYNELEINSELALLS